MLHQKIPYNKVVLKSKNLSGFEGFLSISWTFPDPYELSGEITVEIKPSFPKTGKT